MNEMQVSVEDGGRLNRRLSVIVPNHQLKQSKKNHLTKLAKTTRLNGFRLGTPAAFRRIEQLYGESIWADVIQESLQTSLSDALQKNALNPADQPQIDIIKADPGNDLEYTASFEIYPQILVPELKGVILEKLKVDILETDIDAVLEKMRYQHGDWIEVQRKSQQGDKVTFDLIFTEGEARKDLELIIDEGKIPEGFTCLLGGNAGESFTVSLPSEKGGDQAVAATIEIQKVAEPKIAEINDDFAIRLGISEGGLEALRTQIRQHMQNELDRVLREKLKNQIIDKLLEITSIEELPQVLVEQEYQRLKSDLQGQRKQQSKDKDVEEPLSEKQQEDLQHKADRRVRLGLLFSTLIDKYHLHVDEVRVQQELERIASAFQFEKAMQERLLKDKNMMLNIRSSVLEGQVIDKLLEEVEYTEKTMEYKEIMNLTPKTDEVNTTAMV